MDSAEPARRPVVVLALVGLLILGAGAAEASLLRGFPLPELRGRAAVIAEGSVTVTSAFRDGGTIVTETQLRVERVWKGEPPATLVIRTPGGRIEDRHLRVAGVPRFAAGERIVVFLFRDGAVFRPVGMFQGVWRIDPENPAVARASRAGGASLLIDDGGTPAVSLGTAPIHELVGGPAERPRSPRIGDRR